MYEMKKTWINVVSILLDYVCLELVGFFLEFFQVGLKKVVELKLTGS